MKTKLTLILLSLFFTFNTYGQLPFGAYAEDWTLDQVPDDCDVSGGWGPTWNLYDELDAGKHVAIDFSAVWCGPCWSYHHTGNMQTLWDNYGPDGDNTIRVFYVEADCGTNLQCLCDAPGCNSSNNKGDWLEGVTYPFFSPSGSDCSNITSDYEIGYYPTIYAINAEYRTVWEVKQASVALWESWFFSSFELAVEFDITDDICAVGGGSIDMSTTGGQGTLSFLWSTGEETEDIDGLLPGNYSVTITDQNGYFIIKDVDVFGNDDPILIEEDNVETNLCYGGSEGSIEISVSGGEPDYSYLWSNGETTEDIYDLEAGVYTVVVTDDIGCTEERVFVISEPEELILFVETYDASCSQANGSIIMYAEGGTEPYDYSIGGGYSSQSDYYNLPAGIYTVSVLDYNDCEVFEVVEIEGTDAPVSSAGPDKELTCNSNTVDLDGTGSATGSNITYIWTTTDGHIVSGETTTTPTVDGVGSYIIEVKDSENGCSSKDTTIVNNGGNLPTIIIATPNEINCSVSTSTLNASDSDNGATFTYLWTTTDGNITSGENELIAYCDAAGTYQFTLKNTMNGCTSIKTVQVNDNSQPPQFTVSNAILTCIVSTVDLCVNVTTPFDSIIWTATGASGECITTSESGVKEFTIYGSNGCDVTGTVEATEDKVPPTISILPPGSLGCGVDVAQLDASGSSNGSEFVYLWSTTNGNITGSLDSMVTTVDQAGTYTLKITNSINGCFAEEFVEVLGGAEMPNASFTNSIDYNVINLFGTSAVGAQSTWISGSLTETGDTASFSFNDNGDYEICHILSNSCGADTSCSTISITTILPLSFTDQVNNISCFGVNDGSISVTASGGVGAYSISWSGPNGVSYTDFNITNLVPGDYIMSLTDEGNHSSDKTYIIAEPSEIGVASSITSANDGASDGAIDLTISGGTPPYTYSWSNGSTEQNQNNLAKGEYKVVITDANGCTKEETFIVGVTSIDDPSFIAKFELYPNPALNSTKVDLKFNESIEGKLKLLSISGRIIGEFPVTGKNSTINIDLSELNNGIYLLKLESQDKVGVRKLIKL